VRVVYYYHDWIGYIIFFGDCLFENYFFGDFWVLLFFWEFFWEFLGGINIEYVWCGEGGG
jgi:hypothetical protein